MKISSFSSTVLSISLYVSETWPALHSHIARHEVLQVDCLNTVFGFSLPDHRTNARVCSCANYHLLVDDDDDDEDDDAAQQNSAQDNATWPSVHACAQLQLHMQAIPCAWL